MKRLGRTRWWRCAAALPLACAPALAPAACSVGVVALSFGVYSPLSASPNDSSTSATVTCQPFLVGLLQSYTLSVSTGVSGSYTQRSMTRGASTLHYQLYADAARSLVWGNGSAGTVTINGSLMLQILTASSATHTIYARIPALQGGAVAGAYADTLVVTVTY